MPAAAPSTAPPDADRLQRETRDRQLAAHLAGAAAGSSTHFEAFYDATVGYARALARRILHGADLEDALADAYLDAWRHAGRFDPARGSPVTWLLTLVHSRALDLWRREARHVQPQHPPRSEASPDAEPAAATADPGQQLWQLEAGQRLAAALATLSAQERWVLGLAYFRDLPHAAIAEATGLPLGTVKSLIQRAHGKLRALLADLR